MSDSARPSLGFSRQEHWSGLPFPSPMHKSEKWKWSHSVMSNSLRPHGLQPTRLLRPWDFPGKSTGVGCHFFLRKPPISTDQISYAIQEMSYIHLFSPWRIYVALEIPCDNLLKWKLIIITKGYDREAW